MLQEEGGDSGAGPSGSGGGGNNFEFGVDPSMDPELAMVSVQQILRLDSWSYDLTDVVPIADTIFETTAFSSIVLGSPTLA